MVWLPSLRFSPQNALRSCFISQRSWDSPYRVFPLLQRRSPLKMTPSSHYVGLKTWPRAVKTGFIFKRRIQSIDLWQQVRSQMTRCYSRQIADTLLGLAFLEFSPFWKLKKISPFFLSHAYLTHIHFWILWDASQSVYNQNGRCYLLKRYLTPLRFVTSSVILR